MSDYIVSAIINYVRLDKLVIVGKKSIEKEREIWWGDQENDLRRTCGWLKRRRVD